MAGHSKWANTKHRKERMDQKKGKIFSRIAKEIISAVKQGGADPKSNQKLRVAIQKAKEANMPSENIQRNIKKAGSLDQTDYEECVYELYGFGGVGLILDVMTDNKNRISSEIRIATNKCGGTQATLGAVSYNFERKGVIHLAKTAGEEEELFTLATEKGAEDFVSEEEGYVIYTSLVDFASLLEALEQAGIPIEESALEMVPKTWVEVSQEDGQANLKLIEWLEGLDDVDALYHNMK